MAMAFAVPALGYAWLRRHVSGFDAAAIAAAYGSVSAVTFVTAVQHLESMGLPLAGHMAVAMVLMESLAIIMAVLLANTLRHQTASASAPMGVVSGSGTVALVSGTRTGPSLGKILHESFTDGAHLLLLGAMALGLSVTLNLPLADTVLLMVLTASASYIVVPAVLRYAIPEANPALYFGLSLGVTFPMNILVGIPAYTAAAQWVMNG